ncbi:MAG: 30S ribosomal protein S6 [Acidobacteriota bacterium]|nr:30S ribosomal protein S6 [Acidobacteriota bacterium]MDH3785963.1 30S ribosomal protein S6 [Acidobacteriota bacterium]
MALYETLFITPPTLSEEDEKATVDALLDVVNSGGGDLVTCDRMGRRRLGFPIRKHEDGVYIRFLYDADSEVPKELERRIRLSDQVLRSLTVLLEREWAADARKRAAEEIIRREEAKVEEARRAAEAEAEAKAKAEAGEDAEASAEATESTDTVKTPESPEVSEPATAEVSEAFETSDTASAEAVAKPKEGE